MKIGICRGGARAAVLTAVLTAVLAAGCDGAPGVETITAPITAPIIGGQHDAQHTNVVMISGITTCTGTYLGSGVVVTAEHCVPLTSSGDAVSVTFVDVLGTMQTLESTRYSVIECSEGSQVAARDLAKILIDDAAVPAGITGMPVLDWRSEGLGDGDFSAKLTSVGFGVTLPLGTDRPPSTGTRYRGLVTLEVLDSDIAQISRAAGDAVPCDGDSGGPLLVERAGVEHLAGVLSEGDCESLARYTRADTERAAAFLWGEEVDAEPVGCGDCRSTGGPAGLVPFALWLAAVLWRRRRRPGCSAWGGATARGRSARSR